MARRRVQKPRTHVHRRTGTEIHSDSRSQRERERGQAQRAALARELDELEHQVDEALEGNTP